MINILNIVAPINNVSYGYVSQNIIKQLIKQGIQVNLQPIGPIQIDEEAGYGEFLRKCNNQLDATSPVLIIWHHHSLKQFVRPGQLNIGFPIFEINQFLPQEVEQFNSVNRLFVTCEWYKKVIESFNDKQGPYTSQTDVFEGKQLINELIDIIPLGFDPYIFFPTQKSFLPDETVHFLHIGKWENRKNQLGIIQAFGEEFGPNDNVYLNLACENSFIGEDNKKWEELVYSYIPQNKIKLINHRFSSCKQIAKLINNCHVGVFPSLAEGWGLPLLEMLGSDKLCIATNYSGHTAFCNEDNCLLIDFKEEESCYDGMWFNGQGTWGKWGQEQHMMLKSHLRTAYNHILDKNTKFMNIEKSVKDFTWENSVKKMLEVL